MKRHLNGGARTPTPQHALGRIITEEDKFPHPSRHQIPSSWVLIEAISAHADATRRGIMKQRSASSAQRTFHQRESFFPGHDGTSLNGAGAALWLTALRKQITQHSQWNAQITHVALLLLLTSTRGSVSQMV